MTRAELRAAWRMYWATLDYPVPYMEPERPLSWLERAWIRIFG